MSEFGLTERQLDCLKFIRETIQDTGTCPSFEEMMKRLGLRSKSGVHRVITALEERGHIIRMPGRSRSIALPDAGGRDFVTTQYMHMAVKKERLRVTKEILKELGLQKMDLSKRCRASLRKGAPQ